jgi:hypothetical protein
MAIGIAPLVVDFAAPDYAQHLVTDINAAFGRLGATAAVLADDNTFTGANTFAGLINLPTSAAPSSPADGDIWREDNTNTGLKIRVNGITKTVSLV